MGIESSKSSSRRKLVLISLPIILSAVVIALIVWSMTAETTQMPEGMPVLMGIVEEIPGEDTLVIHTMNRGPGSGSGPGSEPGERTGNLTSEFEFESNLGEKANITIDRHTNIFRMKGRRGERTLERASKRDIQVGTRIAIWGTQQTNGTWYATDIGIMMTRAR